MVLGLVVFSDTEIGVADWRFLQRNFQGEFFYDAEKVIHSSGNTVGIWLKIIYLEKFIKEEGFDDLKQTIGLWEIDCKDKKACLISTSHYAKEE